MSKEEHKIKGIIKALENTDSLVVNVVIFKGDSEEPIISEMLTVQKLLDIFNK